MRGKETEQEREKDSDRQAIQCVYHRLGPVVRPTASVRSLVRSFARSLARSPGRSLVQMVRTLA